MVLYSMTLGSVLLYIHLREYLPLVVLRLAAFPPTILFFPKVAIIRCLTSTILGISLLAFLVATSLGRFMFYLKYILGGEGTFTVKHGTLSLALLLTGRLALLLLSAR